VKVLKTAFILAASITASGAMAQSTPNQSGIDADITLLRSDLQTQRTAVVTQEMNLTDDQGKAFWPLFREYSNKQQVVGDQRVSLIKDYADKYSSMDDATADDLAKRQMKFVQDRMKLQSEYYPKFKKAVGAKQAAKFLQIDNRLNMLVDLQLASNIPVLQ
jgi:Spy/CpxP family protein refolding chaperone